MSETKKLFTHYYVTDCKTLEEFLNKYYKPDRYKGRGKEYSIALYRSHLEDLLQYGIDWISKHDSITGTIVAFSPDMKLK